MALALTLRLVCGVSTGDIARAFLIAEPTMGARVTRAKKKICAARIPYRVPGASELPERLDVVLTVIHLLYTTGHTAPSGTDLVRADLMDSALNLARMLLALMPDEPEVRGLLALLLVPDARRVTRADAKGPGRLAEHHYLPAVRADLLRRLGRHREAATAYRAALDLADNEAEREFLAARLAQAVDSGSDRSPEG